MEINYMIRNSRWGISVCLQAGGRQNGVQGLGLGRFPGPVEELISQSLLQLHLLQPAGRSNAGRSAGTRLRKLLLTIDSLGEQGRHWLAGPGSMQDKNYAHAL